MEINAIDAGTGDEEIFILPPQRQLKAGRNAEEYPLQQSLPLVGTLQGGQPGSPGNTGFESYFQRQVKYHNFYELQIFFLIP